MLSRRSLVIRAKHGFYAIVLISATACSQTNNPEVAKSISNQPSFAHVDTTWQEPVEKSEAEWKAQLTPKQYQVLRQAGTDRAFSHPYNDLKEEGVYLCAACGNPLFDSETKYDSGSGWPSFYAPYFERSVRVEKDNSFGMSRDEVHCARCGGHLGHVFDDGPDPTGLRYCLNGTALKFVDEQSEKLETAYFAQGCFWCVEEIFEAIEGVQEVYSGYSGGDEHNPDYKMVSTGQTNHAEAVEVWYDPTLISYKGLLKVYFNAGDITQVNGQSCDVGKQYRSIVFYKNENEKEQIEQYIASLTDDYDLPIAVEVEPFEKFYKAEDYHQDFVKQNPDNGYVQTISVPRFKKAVTKFPELLKEKTDYKSP